MLSDIELILLCLIAIPIGMYPVYRVHCWCTQERPPYWPWLFWTYLTMCLASGLTFLFDWLMGSN